MKCYKVNTSLDEVHSVMIEYRIWLCYGAKRGSGEVFKKNRGFDAVSS